MWRYLIVWAAGIGAMWFAYHHGETSGAAAVQVRWDAATAAQAAQERKDRQEEERKRVANEKDMAELQGRLDHSVADGSAIAHKLRLAQTASGEHGAAAGKCGVAGPGGGPGGDPELERLSGLAFGACLRDAARLDELSAQVRRHLAPDHP